MPAGPRLCLLPKVKAVILTLLQASLLHTHLRHTHTHLHHTRTPPSHTHLHHKYTHFSITHTCTHLHHTHTHPSVLHTHLHHTHTHTHTPLHHTHTHPSISHTHLHRAHTHTHTHTHTPPSHTRQDQASGNWRQSVGNMMTPPPFSQMRDLPKGSSPWRGAVETVGPGEVTSRAVPSPHSTPPSFTGAPSKLPHCIQGLPALPHRHACAHRLPFTHPGLADLRVRIAHGWSAGHSALPAAVLSPDLHSGLLPPHPGSPFPGQGRKSFHPPTGTKPYVEELTAGPGMAALSRVKGSVLLWCCGCCYPNHRHDLFQLPS